MIFIFILMDKNIAVGRQLTDLSPELYIHAYRGLPPLDIRFRYHAFRCIGILDKTLP